jgi:hypothetical protein
MSTLILLDKNETTLYEVPIDDKGLFDIILDILKTSMNLVLVGLFTNGVVNSSDVVRISTDDLIYSLYNSTDKPTPEASKLIKYYDKDIDLKINYFKIPPIGG